MPASLDLRMPGVHTQEVPTLPPAQGVIPSAVPVFIGYTEKAEKNGESFLNKPTRIKSMKEYEDWFGGPPTTTIIVDVDDRESNPRRPEVRIVETSELYYKMYHALQLYYANGGGPCYILSVAKFPAKAVAPDATLFGDTCFNALKKAKDITILIFPDGTAMTPVNYQGIIEKALLHCVKMKNRVTVIDVHGGEDASKIEKNADTFHNSMPSDLEIKKYGMGYFPFLHTNLVNHYVLKEVSIRNHIQTSEQQKQLKNYERDNKDYLEKQKEADANPSDTNKLAAKTEAETQLGNTTKALNKAFTGNETIAKGAWVSEVKTLMTNLETAQADLAQAKPGVTPQAVDNSKVALDDKVKALKSNNLSGGTLVELYIVNNALYNKIIEAIRNHGVVMPPSPAIAGIYVRTDATQGVWKAPANVSVFGTIKPAIELDDDDHANLNAPDNGKAINVIRAYPGRGILVYGGRTLAGNDLEWRYVSVRRTFCFIEDSIARAMQDFVFEPNTAQTWIKVKSMINSFLNTLWKAGALYGDTPDAAYQVIVGEPESMSVQDVLGGIMRVIIKVAVARPAEFIVLQYEHKFELTEA
jgi:hypothetical protein